MVAYKHPLTGGSRPTLATQPEQLNGRLAAIPVVDTDARPVKSLYELLKSVEPRDFDINNHLTGGVLIPLGHSV